MPIIIDGVEQAADPKGLFESLNDIATILGTVATTFWPFLEAVGTQIVSYHQKDHDLTPQDELAKVALEQEFAPHKMPGGTFSYYFDAAGNQHLRSLDHADFDFGNGTADNTFAVGAWILPLDITTVILISKYDAVGTARQWLWSLDGSSKLSLELFDESASPDAFEIGAGDTAVTTNIWTFVCTVYDGEDETPKVLHYLNGAVDGAGATTETGTYVAMEALAPDLIVGASGATTAPVNEFNGRIALPFVCGKQLTAAEVGDLYQIGRPLIGV